MKSRTRSYLLFCLLLFMMMTGIGASYSANRYSVASGNWNSTSTWSVSPTGGGGASVPVAGDVVFLQSGFGVVVTANAVCTSINFTGTGATLTVNSSISLSASGAITENSNNSASYSNTITGAGTLNCASLVIGTNVIPSSDRNTTMTISISNLTVSGNLTLYSSDDNSNQNNAIFNFSSGTLTVNGSIVSTKEDAGQNSTTLTMATGSQNGILILGGSTPFNLGSGTNNITLNGTATVVNYTGAAQTVYPTTYNDLILSGTNSKTMTSVTVNNLLSMEGTATATVSPTYAGTATLQYNTPTARIVGNEWPANFAATGGIIIANSGAISLNANKTLGSSVPLTINAGSILNTSTNNYAITLGGDFINNGGSFIANGSPVAINGTAGTQSISGFTTSGVVSMTKTSGTATLQSNVSAGSLSISGTGGTLNLGNNLNHTVNGDVDILGNILNGGTNSSLTVSGNWAKNGGTFTPGSGTVNFTGSAMQTIGGTTSTSFNNISINNISGISLTNNLVIAGTFQLTSGIVTTGINTLSLTNGSAAALSGGSTNSFIDGALTRTLVPGQTYNYPVGRGSIYLPFGITGITGSNPQIKIEAFSGSTGGSPVIPLTILSSTEYWLATLTSGTYTGGSVSLTRQLPLNEINVIGRSSSGMNGTYTTLSGSISGTSIINSSNTGSALGYFVMASTRSITTSAISPEEYCPGSSITIPYTITGTFNSGNIFTAQLSDANGLFSSPVSIGTFASQNAGTINGTIPAGQATGSGYRIRVVSGSPSITGSANSQNLFIGLPVITGTTSTSGCGPGPVTLTATANAGVISWYATSTGGSLLATGPTFTTPYLSSSTTFYVDATIGNCISMPRIAVLATIVAPSTITAGGGGTYCPGSTITLTSTGTNLSNQYWTGPNNFYSLEQNPVISNATPAMSGTYTVTGSTLLGSNLVFNGDFELGNTGFGSSYTSSMNLVPEGTYAVIANPNTVHANFVNCADHTANGTLQMVINGAITAGVNVWSQTLPVATGTDYQFTYWVQSVVVGNPSQLQLYINGLPAGPIYTAATPTCQWQQFVYNWNSGTSSAAILSLQNQNTIANGNDFTLDDIVFQKVCSALPGSFTNGINKNQPDAPLSSSIIVTVNDYVTAGTIGSAQTICRGLTPAAITSLTAGTGSGSISYQWQTNESGSFVTIPGATAAAYSPPALTATTSYQRRTVSLSGGTTCYSSFTSPVPITVTGPTCAAGGPNQACQSATPSSITLSGASFGGGATTAAWSIISGGGTLSSTAQTSNPSGVNYTPAVNYSGTVILRLTTNVVSGCNAIADRTISITPSPVSTAGTAISTCANAGAINITAGASAANYLLVTWTSGGTGTFTNPNSLTTATYTPSASDVTAGVVTLTLTATGNAPCVNSVSTKTMTITQPFSAAISYPGSPYCSTAGTVQVSLTGSTGGTFSATPAGLSLNSSSGAINTGTSIAGTYTVLYTILATGGCNTFTTSTTVTIVASPVATFGYPGTPYCQPSANASPVFTGGGIGGIFSSDPGLVFISNTTGVVDVNASTPGSYTVTNTIAPNGPCAEVVSTAGIVIHPPVPVSPGSISGKALQCPGVTGQIYSISPVTNATTYNWTVPTGWTITGGAGTTAITVTTGLSGQNGNISVTAANYCGTSSSSTLSVTVSAAAPVTPGPISGLPQQCPNQSGQQYSINPVPNATLYIWTIPAGWTITGTSGATSIIVSTGNAGQNGDITVTAMNDCGSSAPSTLPVTVSQIEVIATTGTLSACYPSLKGAFDKINDGTHKGQITIRINGSSVETATAMLSKSGGSAFYTDITIFPTASGLSISGNLAAPLIDLSGADNVTIDGRVNATGSLNDLVISNLSTSAVAATSTFRFINDANNNTITYCILKGSSSSTSGGVVNFSSTTELTGNDYNTLINNEITSTINGKPLHGVFSYGTAGKENSNNSISDNNIFNQLNPGFSSKGIFISSNSTDWIISGNSFFETTDLIPTAAVSYYAINIDHGGVGAAGNNFQIFDNFIGGTEATCNGTPLVSNSATGHKFYGIFINAGTTTTSAIYNNTISNIAWASGSTTPWYGIYLGGGNVNIGSPGGNTLGASTGSNSILVTNSTSNATSFGIYAEGNGTCEIRNNFIGSIKTAGSSSLAHSFMGIYKTGAGTTVISNNVVGGATAGSIQASSASSGLGQFLYGINTGSTGSTTISENTISNLSNSFIGTSTSGQVIGVLSTAGINIITSNDINSLTNSSPQSNYAVNASVIGISQTSTAAGQRIAGNTIHNLENLSLINTFEGGVNGIYYQGGTSGTNIVSENFIHSLSLSSSSINGRIHGINIAGGTALYSNNIISLGNESTSGHFIFGISEASPNSNSLYFNTVYLGGITSGTTSPTFSFFSSTTSQRNIRNNIFFNARTGGTTGNHYSICVTSASNLTIDYNDYVTTGTNGILGALGTIYFRVNKNTLSAWQSTTNGDGNSVVTNPGLVNANGTDASDYEPSSILPGITGTGITADYFNQLRGIPPTMGAIDIGNNIVDVYQAGILQASYLNLKSAFDKINNGTHKTGAIQVRINQSTIESATAVLYQSGYSSGGNTSSYTSVAVFGTKPGLMVSGNLSAPLIDLNGADNVTIDGRMNATGTSFDLTITNSSTSTSANTSTIRFINDASNNTIKYCILKGSTRRATGGVIFFSTGSSLGNDNNTIDSNQITCDATNRPVNIIYSLGTNNRDNSQNTISNNLIFNFHRTSTASHAIFISAYSSGWTINGNSFYETTTFSPSSNVSYYIIRVDNTVGSDFTISNNFIGGTAESASGTPWTKTNSNNNTFYGIYLNVGTNSQSNIHGNVIRNFSYSNSGNASWTAIHVASGVVNIGTVSGNTIGSGEGTGSIVLSAQTAIANSYAINIAGTGAVDIQNNTIGSMTTLSSATLSNNFYGINKNAVAGSVTIGNNLIGSLNTANSILAASSSASSAQKVYGISNAGTGTITIIGNTVANVTNAYNGTSNTAQTRGILSTGGTNTIENNNIRNIKSFSGQTGSAPDAALIGIALINSSPGQLVSANTIHDLSNMNTTARVDVYGLFYSGPVSGTNYVSGNFIFGITLASSDPGADYDGIVIYSGSTIVANNIVNLGTESTTGYLIYGISDWSDATCNNRYYFNSVYVGGTVASGTTSNTYAIHRYNNAGSSIYYNNIFFNSRSGGSTGKHYAIGLAQASNAGLIIDYNDYFVTGTNGKLGLYGTSDVSGLANWKTVTGQDANSLSIDPLMVNPGTAIAEDYKPTAVLQALSTTGITNDYGGNIRRNPPTMGAWERLILIRKWKGNVSTDFATGNNWTDGTVPSAGDDIIFEDDPDRHCILDVNRTVGNIVNGQPVDHLIVNGKKLTIQGDFIFSNGARIDAKTVGSEVVFAGSSTQSIPAETFKDNEVYNLTIQNSSNTTLGGTLRLTNLLTTPVGLLDAFTLSPMLEYAGLIAQTINSNTFIDGKVYDLSIDNSAGVTLSSNLTIQHDLTIKSGKKLIVPSTRALTVLGSITNPGGINGFLLQSDASGTASLLHNSTLIPATVERFIGGTTEGWHLLASPVNSQNITGSWIPSGTYGNGTGYDLYIWDEPSNCWIYKLNTTSPTNWPLVHPQSNFIPGKGYLYSFQEANTTKIFTGGLSNGTVSYPITNQSQDALLNGFNLVGNPYPSSIDWKASSGWTRSDLVNSGGGYDMWLWNPDAYNYGVFNSTNTGDFGTNNVSRYIAPMQGYFIRAAVNGNLTTSNDVRTHQGAGNWFKNNSTPSKTVSLTVASGSGAGFDEILLEFGFPENGEGALKLFSQVSTAPSLYLPDNNMNFSVRYLSDTKDNPAIPLNFKTGADGEYSFTCKFNPYDFEIIMLEDKSMNYVQNLKSRATYSFNAKTSDDPSRFILHFGASSSPEIGNLPVRVYSSEGSLAVDLSLIPFATELMVYDIPGKLIFKEKLKGAMQHKIDLFSPSQLLIIHLQNESGSHTQKLLWRNY